MDRRQIIKIIGALPLSVTAFPAIAADQKPDGTATAGNVKLEIYRGKDDNHYAVRMFRGGKTFSFGLEVPMARERAARLRGKKEILLSADGKKVKLVFTHLDDRRLTGLGYGPKEEEVPVAAEFLGWLIGAVLAIVIIVVAVVGASKKIKEETGSELLACAFDLAEKWDEIFGSPGSGPFNPDAPPPELPPEA